MKTTAGCCALLVLLLGCDASDPCDPGEKKVQGACVADEGGGGSSSKPDAGKTSSGGKAGSGSKDKDSGAMSSADDAATGNPGDKDAGSSAMECSEDRDAILHKDCTTDDDCNCAAPYCAKMPGAAMGFCTVFCNPDPDDCPDGYMCFDLSKLGVTGYDPFCVAKN